MNGCFVCRLLVKISFFSILTLFSVTNSKKLSKSQDLTRSTYINVADVTDRAFACLKSVLCIGVDKDHRASNWVLILYQTCTTIGKNCKQELKIVFVCENMDV